LNQDLRIATAFPPQTQSHNKLVLLMKKEVEIHSFPTLSEPSDCLKSSCVGLLCNNTPFAFCEAVHY